MITLPVEPAYIDLVNEVCERRDCYIRVEETTFFGRKFLFAYDMKTFASFYCHVDEYGQRCRWWSQVKEGDVVIDVGAGSGSYVLPALALGAAHVFAFIPEQHGVDDPSIDHLLLSLTANGWRGRCSILPYGLWSEGPGWLNVFSFAPMPEYTNSKEPPVGGMPVMALDALIADGLLKMDRIDWMKVDVEGSELGVLTGASETIRRFRPRVQVENPVFKLPDMDARVGAILEPLGYVAEDRLPYYSVTHTLWTPREKLEATA